MPGQFPAQLSFGGREVCDENLSPRRTHILLGVFIFYSVRVRCLARRVMYVLPVCKIRTAVIAQQ